MKVCVYTFGQNACCGGSTALFKLASLLCDAGCDCRVWQGNDAGNIYGVLRATPEWLDGAWVIYPEVVHGNPLNARLVVRWLLNAVGVIGGDSRSWGADDIVVSYLPRFRSGNEDLLTAFEMWPTLIYPAAGLRSGTCFAVKKGGHKPRIPETDDATEVYASPSIAGPLFRLHERFISYDTATWLSIQSALCGCVSIVVPDDGVSEAEWRENNPFFKYGVAYGFEEVPYAIETMHLVQPHLDEMAEDSRKQVRRLLERMQ